MSRRIDVFLKAIAIGCALFLLIAAGFAYGVAVKRFDLWPNGTLTETEQAARSLVAHGRVVPVGLLKRAPAQASRQRVVVHDAARLNDGYYAILGWDDPSGRYSAWLLDPRGEVMHTWPLDYAALDPDGPSGGSDAPHGFKLLKDGSLLVNFDKGDVMARLDACGRPLWIKQGYFHHSIEGAEDGTYWTWRGEGSAYSQYQYLVQFDPESGETIRELGLVEDVIRRQGAAEIFGLYKDYKFLNYSEMSPNQKDDIFHPNDIDILASSLESRFPGMKAGDLLISLRNLNLVAVLDPANGRIKWWRTGPWRAQHDPDFTADGWISVYNNNPDRGRSDIYLIQPTSGKVRSYSSLGGADFYSEAMGKHQYLPNGNVLVIVPGEGRVLELAADGALVYEFNNIANGSGRYNGHVENGLWVDKGFLDAIPSCSSESR